MRACAEAGGVRTRRKPAAASEGEAKEDRLNAYKSYNIVGMEGVDRGWSYTAVPRPGKIDRSR